MATKPKLCAHCQAPTGLRCAGCVNCPTPDLTANMDVFYCSRVCQVAQFTAHKAACKAARHRRALVVVCDTVKEAVFTFRRLTFDTPLLDVHVRDGVLGFTQARFALPQRPGGHTHALKEPMWSNLTPEVQLMMLAYEICEELVIVASEILRFLLHPIATCMSTMSIIPKTTRADQHCVLCIELRSGEQNELFALDLAGVQYGWTQTIYPFDEYYRTRVQQIVSHSSIEQLRYAGENMLFSLLHAPHSKWFQTIMEAVEHRIGPFYEIRPIEISDLIKHNKTDAIDAWLTDWKQWYNVEVVEDVSALDGQYDGFLARVPSDDEIQAIIHANLDDTGFLLRQHALSRRLDVRARAI